MSCERATNAFRWREAHGQENGPAVCHHAGRRVPAQTRKSQTKNFDQGSHSIYAADKYIFFRDNI